MSELAAHLAVEGRQGVAVSLVHSPDTLPVLVVGEVSLPEPGRLRRGPGHYQLRRL